MPPARGSILTNARDLVSLAERVGFEPTVPFPVHTISSRAPSTARSPLQSVWGPLAPSNVTSKFLTVSGGLAPPKPPLAPGQPQPAAPPLAITPLRALPPGQAHPPAPALACSTDRNLLSPTDRPHRSAYVAESEGFEPPVPLPVHLISSQAPSTELGQLSVGGFIRSSRPSQAATYSPGPFPFPRRARKKVRSSSPASSASGPCSTGKR